MSTSICHGDESTGDSHINVSWRIALILRLLKRKRKYIYTCNLDDNPRRRLADWFLRLPPAIYAHESYAHRWKILSRANCSWRSPLHILRLGSRNRISCCAARDLTSSNVFFIVYLCSVKLHASLQICKWNDHQIYMFQCNGNERNLHDARKNANIERMIYT